MKNFKLSAIFCTILTVILLSCSNEDKLSTSSESDQQITLENGELKFSSIESYENLLALGALTTESLSNKLGPNYSSFTSLHKKLSKKLKNYKSFSLKESSPILNILNNDKMVTIGTWTFLINLDKELVAVVDSKNKEYKTFLKEMDISKPNIKWFSTEDDVLSLLEENSNGTLNTKMVQQKLNKQGIQSSLIVNKNTQLSDCIFFGGLDNTTNILKDKKIYLSEAQCGSGFDCKRWLADAKHVYQKAGIYFSLQSKIKYRGDVPCVNNAPYAINTNLTLNVNYSYERRRRFKKNIKRNGTKIDASFSNELSYRPHEGSRSLKKYSLKTTFTYIRKDNCAEDYGCYVSPNPVTIILPEIKN